MIILMMYIHHQMLWQLLYLVGFCSLSLCNSHSWGRVLLSVVVVNVALIGSNLLLSSWLIKDGEFLWILALLLVSLSICFAAIPIVKPIQSHV